MKRIKAVFEEFTCREGSAEEALDGKRAQSSEDVYHLMGWLKDETKEHFYALHLDAKNRIINVDLISLGSMTAAIVHPREVFKTALLSSANSILFVHNHPSGEPTPSREDLALTRRLADGGELLGIRVLDHIIIGDGSYRSLRETGFDFCGGD